MTLSKSKIALNNSQEQQIELNPKKGISNTTDDDEDFNDEELNELCVEDARKYDHRTFIEFYWYLLKTKQDIINTFFNSDPLDCFTVRCVCFIYGIAVYFFVNALFFIESYINSTLHGEEHYSFISIFQNEISRLIYSSIVAIFVDMFANCLSNSKKRLETLIRKMKNEKTIYERFISNFKKSSN